METDKKLACRMRLAAATMGCLARAFLRFGLQKRHLLSMIAPNRYGEETGPHKHLHQLLADTNQTPSRQRSPFPDGIRARLEARII